MNNLDRSDVIVIERCLTSQIEEYDKQLNDPTIAAAAKMVITTIKRNQERARDALRKQFLN